MKLYTEEQVNKIVLKSRETGLTADFFMLTITPIELPSDEEIEESSEKGYVVLDGNRTLNWINGAKWMKEQILNQNK
jgi:hypothetical protein